MDKKRQKRVIIHNWEKKREFDDLEDSPKQSDDLPISIKTVKIPLLKSPWTKGYPFIYVISTYNIIF